MATKMSSAKSVWVPGGTGMLGRAVCRHLRAQGVTPRATGHDVDIASASAVDAFAEAHPDIGAIINCAAKTAVDVCESERDDAMRTNAEGPKRLATIARSRQIPIAHVSTDYVFAGDKDAPYVEEDTVLPQTVYGESKSHGERALYEALGDDSLGYVVRTAWLFGHEGNNFVKTMLRLMREREEVQVVTDQRGSPTFCDDLAEALVRLVGIGAAARAAGGTYHFANDGETSWHGLASAAKEVAEDSGVALRCQRVAQVTSEAFVRPAKRPAYSVLSTQKIARALKKTPRPWREALHAYVTREPTILRPA